MATSGWNLRTLWALALSLLLLPALGAAAVQVNIAQCANYKAGTGDHHTCEDWVNGNVNANKAFYFEGGSVGYRLYITGLIPGRSYTATIQWDATQGDMHAMDYLTGVDRTVLQADPCQGLSVTGGCDRLAPDSTLLIPIDVELEKGHDRIAGTADDVSQATPEFLKMWNASLTGTGSYQYTPDPWNYLSTTKISLPITFTANASDVLLAWGGHISTRLDWGEANSAINISGSPYHMRLLSVYDNVANTTVASGNRDLQLAASAVFFPITLTIEKTTDIETNDSFDFTSNRPAPDDAFALQSCFGGGTNCTYDLIVTEESTVNVTETDPGPLWALDDITCLDLSTEPPTAQPFTAINDGHGVSLTLSEGAMVKCTFTNVFAGAPLLVVQKKVIEATQNCNTVDFDDAMADELLEIASGDTVKYCYRVRNTGDAPAFNITLEDDGGDLLGALPFTVTLAGGDLADLDGGGIANDLDAGGATFGEAQVPIDEPTGTTVTNIATADADNADEVTDSAQVEVVDRADCLLSATVNTGACPGTGNTLNLAGAGEVTWCAEICWPDTANSDLTVDLALLDGDEDPLVPPVSSGPIVIAPDTCSDPIGLSENVSASVQRILKASGQDAYDNIESCQGAAAVNVYNPDISIVKLVSPDADCTDANNVSSLEVYTGSEVWYCFTVSNDHEGAEDLTNVQFTDPALELNINIGNLPADGTPWTHTSGPHVRTSEVNNTASVSGEGAQTSEPVSDQSSAIVTVVYADIVVEKSGTQQLDVSQGESDIAYLITVRNIGTTTAKDVMLTDALPEAFVYVSDDHPGCSYEDNNLMTPGGGSLTCDLGDIEPGLANQVSINVTGTLAPEFVGGMFDNQACAYPGSETTDADLTNNCDETTTLLIAGATRTIGWWGNHPDMMAACLEANDGQIDVLGFVSLDTTEDAIGIIKTNIALDLCKDRRDDLTKARLQAGRQVLAAYCNVTYLGAAEPDWMADASSILAGDDIPAILQLGGQADAFNNSSDNEPLPEAVDPSPANPHFAWTDPTSPAECTLPAKGKPEALVDTANVSGNGSGCTIGSTNRFDPLLLLLLLGAIVVTVLRSGQKV